MLCLFTDEETETQSRSHVCQAKSRRLNLEAGWAWTLYGRVCSQPGGPAPPPASGQRGVAETPQRGCGWFCCRVRLALLQGLSQLPGRASQADCLPCTEEGRLLSGLISCQLSVFFLCFCCSLRQTDGVGRPEKQDFQSGALLEQGTFTLGPAPSGSILLPRPSLLLRSGFGLSPNLPTALYVQAPQQPSLIF